MARQSKAQRILTHSQVWTALDRLAERAGMSPSGLASAQGSTPPPSTKSSASPLTAASGGHRPNRFPSAWPQPIRRIDTFVQLIGDGARSLQSVRCSRWRKPAAAAISTRAAFPPARGWDEVALPQASDEHAYALEISGDSMKPAYRDGDIIVVSPGTAIRRGRPRGAQDV